jgi:hypothetical protein
MALHFILTLQLTLFSALGKGIVGRLQWTVVDETW